MTWTEFKAKKLGDIKKGECLKIIGDGQVGFYAVIDPQGGMIARIEGICSQIDASKGF